MAWRVGGAPSPAELFCLKHCALCTRKPPKGPPPGSCPVGSSASHCGVGGGQGSSVAGLLQGGKLLPKSPCPSAPEPPNMAAPFLPCRLEEPPGEQDHHLRGGEFPGPQGRPERRLPVPQSDGLGQRRGGLPPGLCWRVSIRGPFVLGRRSFQGVPRGLQGLHGEAKPQVK